MNSPRVGDIVIYTNSHGFPRAAIVTGTKDSLKGELHVPLIEDPNEVHLMVFSPLPRTYGVQHVKRYTGEGDPIGMWHPTYKY